MQRKNTRKQPTRKGSPAKPRLGMSTYRMANYLDTMKASAEDSMLVADALTLWTRFMLAADPTFAGSLYRALCTAWRVNLANGEMFDATDTITTAYHVSFLNRLCELRDTASVVIDGYDRNNNVATTILMRATLDAMLARVTATGAPCGRGGRGSDGYLGG